jgi:hypothetical protein
MKRTIALEVASALSEKGFSLDELVFRAQELFEKEGIAGFVALLLELVDEGLNVELVQGKAQWKPKACCEDPCYEHSRRAPRRFRTSVGVVRLQWRRLRCTRCGKTVVPLREFLGLKPYQSKSAELERTVLEVVSEQNYRRTSRHLDVIGMIPVPKSTAHRWVMESNCDEIDVDGKVVDVLVADGTGYKRRPEPEKGKNNRGKLRIALGVASDGTVVPFGAWADKNWTEIGNEMRQATRRISPKAKILVSDGELGLAEGLAEIANEQQRSHWHLTRDLGVYLWRDDARASDRKEMPRRLAGILGVELPREDFQEVKSRDKARLEKTTEEAENKIDELIEELKMKGYGEAATYVSRAAHNLFAYVRLWLKYGLVSPRASSMIERMMRELGRRIKKIAHGWKERGVAKMARLIIKRITTANEWEKYWYKRLRITGNVALSLRAVRAL